LVSPSALAPSLSEGAQSTASNNSATSRAVTYDQDAKLILAQKCTGCHGSGSSIPLTTHQQAKSVASRGQLARAVSSGGAMAQYAGASAQTLLAWVAQGTLQSAPAAATTVTPATQPTTGTGTESTGTGQSQMSTSSAGGTTTTTASATLTYDQDLKAVFDARCVGCHSALGTYQQAKAYADSGRLKQMVGPGGAMAQYAGTDAQKILDWIAQGAPQSAQGTAATPTNPTASTGGSTGQTSSGSAATEGESEPEQEISGAGEGGAPETDRSRLRRA